MGKAKSASISRRAFLRQAGLVSLGFAGLNMLACKTEAYVMKTAASSSTGYGALRRDPYKILDLPSGFSYRIISRQGNLMDDRLLVPGKPDGMAAFPGPDGLTIVVRNHELEPDMVELGPFGAELERLPLVDKSYLYDYGHRKIPALGGCSTVVFDTQYQSVKRQFMTLLGTTRNCAGGPTPRNTWITCEESVDHVGELIEQDHGYPFEVPALSRPKLIKPQPIKQMGRFRREAVCTDPRTGIVYQSEDRPDGLIYRYIPQNPDRLLKGGRLQVMAILDEKSCDTRNWQMEGIPRFETGQPRKVGWIDIDEIHSPKDDLRYRGYEAGAARFARGEGMWFGNGEVYFACTNGGPKLNGQIFKYLPSPDEGSPGEKSNPGTLELFLEPNNGDLLRNADNLTQSPLGDLVICEDHRDARLVCVTPEGKFYLLAQSRTFDSEFAGATFSPDGSTLFVNIQHAGLTLAITGPWEKRKA